MPAATSCGVITGVSSIFASSSVKNGSQIDGMSLGIFQIEDDIAAAASVDRR